MQSRTEKEIELTPLTGISNATNEDNSSLRQSRRVIGSFSSVYYVGIALAVVLFIVVTPWSAPGEYIAMTTNEGTEAVSITNRNGNFPILTASKEQQQLNATIEVHKQGGRLPPDQKLRFLASLGCSGSSFVFRTLSNILGRHGYDMWLNHKKMLRKSYKCGCKTRHQKDQCGWGGPEVYKPYMNCFFEEANAMAPPHTTEKEIIVNATLMMHNLMYQNGWTSLYKWFPSRIDEVISQAGSENVLVGELIRENPVDWLICEVKDCFAAGKLVGTLVFYNETANVWEPYKQDTCFSRRKANIETKAYFYEDEFDKMINILRNHEKRKKSSIAYEDLTAFQNTDDEEVFQRSIEAWRLLANRFVVDSNVDYDTIESEIGKMRNSRTISYQEETVQNYESFFQAIRNAGLGKYIRTQTQL